MALVEAVFCSGPGKEQCLVLDKQFYLAPRALAELAEVSLCKGRTVEAELHLRKLELCLKSAHTNPGMAAKLSKLSHDGMLPEIIDGLQSQIDKSIMRLKLTLNVT